MALVVLNDLNGDHYLGLQEGEVLVSTRPNTVYFPDGMKVAHTKFDKPEITQDEADLFIAINFAMLKAEKRNGADMFTDHQAAIIAYHRLVAVKEGLISPDFVAANFNVNYTETFRLDKAATDKFALPDKNKISAVLTPLIQKEIATTFTDRVCLVAFVFRARGHHYTADYEDLYDRIWKKCRYDPLKLHISFQHLATNALHAIFPSILDDFWSDSVTSMHANGALAKRIDVAPAGSAGPYVLRQGIEDLAMIAPGIRTRLRDAVAYLDRVLVELAKHRFAGSVNAKYYGTAKVKFDEKQLSAIAATIVSAIDGLTEDAPIGKSPALRRIASNAPITGAVLARTIREISTRSEVVNTLLIEEVTE